MQKKINFGVRHLYVKYLFFLYIKLINLVHFAHQKYQQNNKQKYSLIDL